MRRFVSVLILSLFATASYSQMKEDLSITPSVSWLTYAGDSYFYIAKTTNQFDDMVWLDLGSNKEECLQTLNFFLNLIDQQDKYTVFKSGKDDLILTYVNFMGKGLWIKKPYNADNATLTKAGIKKMIKFFNAL